MQKRWTSHLSQDVESNGKQFLLPVIFDPRTKGTPFSFLSQDLQTLALNLARKEFQDMDRERSEVSNSSQGSSPPLSSDAPTSKTKAPQFWTVPQKPIILQPEDELDDYLRAEGCPKETPVSQWFVINPKFPRIFKLYRKWCCSPGASTSVERLWSSASHLDGRLRARLSPELIGERLFIKKNAEFCHKLPK